MDKLSILKATSLVLAILFFLGFVSLQAFAAEEEIPYQDTNTAEGTDGGTHPLSGGSESDFDFPDGDIPPEEWTTLDTAEKSIANLVSAIERGIASDAIVNRMAELEGQKTALRRAIADDNGRQGPTLTRDHISFFLEQFRNLDYTDRECQRRLLNVFVNAIFLYDDEFTLVFNFGEESRTITLAEKNEAEAGDVFAQHCIKPE